MPKTSSAAPLTDYELERQRNIQRNLKLLQELGLADNNNNENVNVNNENDDGSMAFMLPSAMDVGVKKIKLDRPKTKSAPKKKDADLPKRPTTTSTNVRTSRRLRGEATEVALIDDPEAIPAHVADTLKEKDLNSNNTDKENDEVNGLDGVLYTAEEFFDEEIVAKAIKVDGKYRGWINPVVVEKYGLEEEAIKEEMGKNRNSNSSSSSTKGKPHGMSSARFASSQKLRKNPNAYFYRHNEPGLEQWTGDWTEEEINTFLNVARTHGCGDKWGLFASYIPHRVGYQCSNVYRSLILPSGLIFDPNYRFTKSGTAIFVGMGGSSNTFKWIQRD